MGSNCPSTTGQSATYNSLQERWRQHQCCMMRAMRLPLWGEPEESLCRKEVQQQGPGNVSHERVLRCWLHRQAALAQQKTGTDSEGGECCQRRAVVLWKQGLEAILQIQAKPQRRGKTLTPPHLQQVQRISTSH
jgi:hypothetical protein